jgi:tRNA threonylcarbamoyladenosine biosynthesis protein TsaB
MLPEMMHSPTILAIETSTDACSVAVCHQSLIQETFVVQPREHNKLLLPMVDEILQGLHLSCDDLDAIAFGAGPGSFTGLRLSAGVVQGLAFAAQKPVIPVSSLATLALSAAGRHFPSGHPATLLTVVNAHMQDVYFAAYRYHDGAVTALVQDTLLPASQLPERIPAFTPALVIQNGFREPLSFPAGQGVVESYPHAKEVLALAKLAWASGQTVNAAQALPVYLRETISWQKWQPKGNHSLAPSSPA